MPRTITTASGAAGRIALVSLLLAPVFAHAQTARQSTIATPAQQIALAVLPAPRSMRDNATVLGYNQDGKLMTLRQGGGGLICLAPNPKETQFHVSCYHKSLGQFMARGREVRATLGDKRGLVDSVRLAEIKAGKIKMPSRAVLYQEFASRDSVDVATAAIKSPSYLNVIYIPYATMESTGIAIDAPKGTPWLMYPGKPWAHVMLVQ
jgi:hypothetical protein